MKKGGPGLETWGSLDGAKHGAGNVWIPGSYDPETHLYIFGTGNPSPAYTNPPSRAGDNLYTCSIVAINVDTGKLARSEEHTSELQSHLNLVCRLLLEKKKTNLNQH